MEKVWFIVLLFLVANMVCAQKMVVMERTNSLKSKRWAVGDEITFRKSNDKDWQEATIVDVIARDSIIVLDRQYMKLADISHIRTYRNRGWSKAASVSLFTFGAAWAGFTLGDELADRSMRADWEAAAVVGATSVASGALVRYLFRRESYRLSKRTRLRLIDLSIR